MFKSYRNRRLLTVGALAGAALLFSGCASAPMAPTASLNEAKLAIQAAEKSDASHYAGAELDQARQKLALADEAVAAKDMIVAKQFAHESTVTANLAAAKTEATKAEAINKEMSKGADALIEEMQRAGEQQ